MSGPFGRLEWWLWLVSGVAIAVGAIVAEACERRAHRKETAKLQRTLGGLRGQLREQRGALGVISTMSARTLESVRPAPTTATLRLFFEPRNPSCVHKLPPRHPLGEDGTLWRVGIENTSDIAAEGVCLRVASAVEGATGLPAALHKMHDSAGQTHFKLSPHSTDYWDVLMMPYRYSSEIVHQLDLNLDAPTPHIYVCLVDPVTPWFPVAIPWVLRFRVEAHNAATPVEAGFRLSFSDGTLTVGYSDYPSTLGGHA